MTQLLEVTFIFFHWFIRRAFNSFKLCPITSLTYCCIEVTLLTLRVWAMHEHNENPVHMKSRKQKWDSRNRANKLFFHIYVFLGPQVNIYGLENTETYFYVFGALVHAPKMLLFSILQNDCKSSVLSRKYFYPRRTHHHFLFYLKLYSI